MEWDDDDTPRFVVVALINDKLSVVSAGNETEVFAASIALNLAGVTNAIYSSTF